MIRTSFAAAALAVSAMAGASNAATELVTNGGFESGLSPWVCSVAGTSSRCEDTAFTAFTGTSSLIAFDNNGTGSAVQSIATVAGETYDVDFWVRTNVLSANSLYSYSLGDGSATGLSFAAIDTWYNIQSSFVASGISSDISFFFNTSSGSGALYVDDVSMMGATAAIPVPAALPLLATGLGLFGFFGRRKSA